VLIRGEIVFRDDAKPLSGASIRVTVEDVTYADARAPVIAEGRVGQVEGEGANRRVPFSIEVPDSSSVNQVLGIRALIDADHDGAFSKGDYTNVVSVRVRRDQVGLIEVPVEEIAE
jgi:hypothetical protein